MRRSVSCCVRFGVRRSISPSVERVRAFIALDLPAHVGSALEAQQRVLGPRLGAARWIGPHAFHVTLKFLGSLERPRILELVRLLENVARGSSAFRARLGELDAFSTARHAHVLVVHLLEDGSLARFQRLIEEAAAAVGFAPEGRPFRPHVTLARFKPPRDLRAVLPSSALYQDTFVLDRVRLYRSQPGSTESRYEPLASVELTPRGR